MLSVMLRKSCANVSALSDSSGDALPSAEPSAADGTPDGPIEHATRARHDQARHPEHTTPGSGFRGYLLI